VQKHLPDKWGLVSLLLLIAGAVTFNLSLYSLATANAFPLYTLLAGIFLQALAVTLFVALLLRDNHGETPQNFYLIFILVLSVSLAFTRLSRYAGFNGFDFVRESEVMQNTFRSGRWDLSLGLVSNYQSSLGITILPVMASRFLLVPADQVLLLQTFLLTALLPLVVLGVVSSLTGNLKFGTLSAALLAQNWFFFGAHIIGKTSLALVFCVLSFYYLLRPESRARAIGVLLGLGVAWAHYTVALMLVFILLALLVWSKMVVPLLRHFSQFENAKSIPVNVWPVAATVGLVVVWLLVAAPGILPALFNSSSQLFSSLSNVVSGPQRVSNSLAISSDAGPLVTYWFDFQNGLIGFGSLLWLNAYRKGNLQGRLAGWLFVGISLIILLLCFLFLPYLSISVESTRILAIILPFTILFSGVILLHALRRPGRMLKAAALGIVFLMLPMNMMLPNQDQNILYHGLDSLSIPKKISVESISLPTDSNGAMDLWIVTNVPLNNPVEVDAVGRYALITAVPFPQQVLFLQEHSPPYGWKHYGILSSYFMIDGTWSIATLGNRTFVPADPSPFFSPTHDVIYSSSKFWVVVGRNP